MVVDDDDGTDTDGAGLSQLAYDPDGAVEQLSQVQEPDTPVQDTQNGGIFRGRIAYAQYGAAEAANPCSMRSPAIGFAFIDGFAVRNTEHALSTSSTPTAWVAPDPGVR